MTAPQADPAYQVRFGVTRQGWFLLPLCILLMAGGVMMFREGRTWAGGGAVIFFGLCIVRSIVHLVSRRVALRVAPEGVTLSLSPPWPERNTAVVPWADIRRIVLWRQRVWTHLGHHYIRYIGLERRSGAPPLPGSARGRVKQLNVRVSPRHVPPGVVADSRPITGWQLDEERLAAAVDAFAPQVTITAMD